MNARKTVDVYFDYASPFVYIATQILRERLDRRGVDLAWKAIRLDGLSNYADGPPYSDLKRRYVVIDALRSAEFFGVETRLPKPHPVRSDTALRLALVAAGDRRFEELHRALSTAAWFEQKDLGDRSVLAACIASVGGPVDDWLAAAESQEWNARLEEATQQAEGRGVFGVPSFVFEDELFWGLDSLAMLEWRLDRSR